MPTDERGQYESPDVDLNLADVASAARTATGTSTAFDTTNVDSVNATLVITAASGTTPTLDLVLQTTADGTNWYSLTPAFPQQTTTTTGVSRVIGDLGDSCRWQWTIGGTTPSFTFSIASTVDQDT